MTKCKFAGDPSDTFCENCNGIECSDGVDKYDAIECTGFEPIEENEEVQPEEIEEEQQEYDGFMNTPDGIPEELPFDEPKEQETSISTQEQEKQLESQNTSSESYISKAKVKSICYSVGMTIEKKGEYHKIYAQEEWELTPECDIEKERELLWQHLIDQVEDRIDEI